MTDKTKLWIVAMICGTILFIAVFVWPTRAAYMPRNGNPVYRRSLAGDLFDKTLHAIGLREY